MHLGWRQSFPGTGTRRLALAANQRPAAGNVKCVVLQGVWTTMWLLVLGGVAKGQSGSTPREGLDMLFSHTTFCT
jgi:hypothetical protein